MVLITTSFHLFGITPLICTPSLIWNLRTAFAHPPRRKIFIPSLIWTKGAVLDTHLSGFLKNIFCSSLICYGNSVLDTQIAKKNIPLYKFPQGKPKCTPFLRENFYLLTYLQWERVFFKSVLKIFSHLFPLGTDKIQPLV